jgi:regulator of replication initiation timing
MLQLDLQLSPPSDLQLVLQGLQDRIDQEPEFEKRCEKAQSTWKNKPKSTAEQLIDCLRELSHLCPIKAANSRQEVERCLYPGANMLDWSQPLDLIQADLTQSFKNLLLSQSHPAVWHAIKVIASKTEQKWQEIFHQIPEALTW